MTSRHKKSLHEIREGFFLLPRSGQSANYLLTTLFYVNSPKPQVCKKKVLSKEQQTVKYRNLLESGKVKSRAELAGKFGVSRAWVPKVLNFKLRN